MSRRITVTLEDPIYDGLTEQCEWVNQKPNKFVEQLIRKEIKNNLQCKIISYYQDGSERVEDNFYSTDEFAETFIAYGSLVKEKTATNWGIMIGYQAFKQDYMVSEAGKTNKR